MAATRNVKPADLPWGQPLLRWAGSKRKLLPELMTRAPAAPRRYVEPFAGSACLFFALKPARAVLGDINSELLETYSVLTKHPRLLARAVHSIKTTKREYYRIRRIDPKGLSPLDRAARFIYLNRNCFNGVYRTNQLGCFNVPRGLRTGDTPNERIFVRCAYALRSAEFRPGDFANCLSDVRKGDFVYLDPPYAIDDRRLTGEYGYGTFQSSDLVRLIECLRTIDRGGAHFLLSYLDCPLLRKLVDRAWARSIIAVRRHVAGFSKHRSTVNEVLISNVGK